MKNLHNEVMKNLNEYIIELNEQMSAAEAILGSIKVDGLKREQMIDILAANDMKTIKAISDILKAKHKENYFPYEPQKDDFLKESEKEKICGQIVDAVMKLEK